ncbi:RNA polymerase sigma factor [Coralloluteibacterium stylophorae]|uniref:Sigma-70 family RNA polymerase sigma factor n=1 Tax=Coralloluteibacterium stylophorae TaxID=1776034 RepID=A0A8J7VQT1_9GAMM|nr:sigma-70 family RNA polymerase sigma factor [Coralloluteibacterium stylophorae]
MHPDTAPDPREDELLAIRCQLGEAEAFDALIRRWEAPLREYVLRRAGPVDAADVVQDTWLRIVRGIGRLRDPRRLRAWLFAVARRAWMDHLRTRYAAPGGAEADPDLLAADEDVAAEAGLDSAPLVRAVLGRLPPVERRVLDLFHLREYSLDEIARITAVPVGTVKSRLFRARRLARAELERRGMGR